MRSLRSIVDVIKPKNFGISHVGRFNSVPITKSPRDRGAGSTTAIAASTSQSASSKMQTLQTVQEDNNAVQATGMSEFDEMTAKITASVREKDRASTMQSQSSDQEIKIRIN